MSVTKNTHTYDSIVEALGKKVDPKVLRRHKGKSNKIFTYLPHGHATAMLNDIFGFEAWSFEPLPDTLQQLADESWIIFVRLTIHDHWNWGHDIVAVEVGCKEHVSTFNMAIGDEIKSAVSLGLSRAAMRACGLAIELWLKDDDVFLSEHTVEEVKRIAKTKEKDPLTDWAVELYKEQREPAVKVAVEELGAVVTEGSAQNVDVNVKIDWSAFYAWAEDEGFSRTEAQDVLAKKAGGRGKVVELTKKEMADAILEAKGQ